MQTTANIQQPTTNKQQATNNKQQTTNNKQQTTNGKQQTTNHKQQTANNRQQRKELARSASAECLEFGAGCTRDRGTAFRSRKFHVISFGKKLKHRERFNCF